MPIERTYEYDSLDVWLSLLNFDWEKKFSSDEVEYGRILYKANHIKSLDLSKSSLSVCADMPDWENPYIVVDYVDNDFAIRSSKKDKFLMNSLAVAAFYELEELLSELCTSLDIADKIFARENNQTQPAESSENIDEPKAMQELEPMKILLDLNSTFKGLKLELYWLDKNGQRQRVFGKNCVKATSLSDDEAGQLVKLINLFRKNSLVYKNGYYLLEDATKIPYFLKYTLKVVKDFVVIKKQENVKKLEIGNQTLNLNPKAIYDETDSFEIELFPKIGGVDFDGEDLYRIYNSNSNTFILPKYGIVSLESSELKILRKLESTREFFGDKIPNYMLLTLDDFNSKLSIDTNLSKWIKSLTSSRQDIYKSLPNFLRNYQKKGVAWAINLFEHDCNALIADEMGLGKTVQTLSLIDYYAKDTSSKFIVVCPASVISVWINEINKFYPKLKVGVLSSKSDIEDMQICLASYTQLRRNKAKLESITFDLAVLDEAQFIKNPEAKTSVACMAIKAKKKLALTGTPIENKILDMWSVFKWLMVGLMGTRGNFEKTISSSKDAIEIVRKQIAPFVLRRLKKQVASELPEKIYINLECSLNAQQRSEYNKLLAQARGELESSNKLTILSLLTRLRQVACDASLLPWVKDSGDGGKISVLMEKFDELFASDKKVLVFSQYTKFLDLIDKKAQGLIAKEAIHHLRGSTLNRQKPVEAFQNSKKASLMLVSLKAGGTGITLTNADYVFIADPWWNPAVEDQAVDRVHRIGRKGDVFVYRLIAKDSVESRVQALQLDKRNLSSNIIGNLNDVSNKDSFMKTIEEILK